MSISFPEENHVFSINEKINFCTFDKTGNSFKQQYWKRCYDCWPNEENGACLHCISVCHSGHTVDYKVRLGNFFCDCGDEAKNCKLTTATTRDEHRIPQIPRSILQIPTALPTMPTGWDKIIKYPPGQY